MFGINFNLPGKAGTFTNFTKFELLELLNNIFENSSPTEYYTKKISRFGPVADIFHIYSQTL